MKFVMLLALLASLQFSSSAFAQTNNTEATPAATTPSQDQMGAPAAGESSMAGSETKHTKKHAKSHKGKKKHHKKKKHHATPAS